MCGLTTVLFDECLITQLYQAISHDGIVGKILRKSNEFMGLYLSSSERIRLPSFDDGRDSDPYIIQPPTPSLIKRRTEIMLPNKPSTQPTPTMML